MTVLFCSFFFFFRNGKSGSVLLPLSPWKGDFASCTARDDEYRFDALRSLLASKAENSSGCKQTVPRKGTRMNFAGEDSRVGAPGAAVAVQLRVML
jgi:hypothetical protein